MLWSSGILLFDKWADYYSFRRFRNFLRSRTPATNAIIATKIITKTRILFEPVPDEDSADSYWLLLSDIIWSKKIIFSSKLNIVNLIKKHDSWTGLILTLILKSTWPAYGEHWHSACGLAFPISLAPTAFTVSSGRQTSSLLAAQPRCGCLSY